MKKHTKVSVSLSQIEEQAKLIRDVTQRIIDACQSESTIDPYARNKATGGSLACDAAVLGIMIVQHEMQE